MSFAAGFLLWVLYCVVILSGIWVMGHIPERWADVPHFDRWLKKDRHLIPWFWEK